MDTARTIRTVSTLLYVAAIMVAVFAGGDNAVGAVAAVGAILLAAMWVATGRMIRADGGGRDRRRRRRVD